MAVLFYVLFDFSFFFLENTLWGDKNVPNRKVLSL